MTLHRRPVATLTAALVATFALAACRAEAPTPPPQSKSAPAAAKATAPVAAVAPPLPAVAPPTVALPATDLPAGPIYFCDVGGVRTPLALAPGVENLCRRHPEMSACQFERSACRATGGRVYTSKGEEVTPAVEARYDERVRRVLLQSDGAPAKK